MKEIISAPVIKELIEKGGELWLIAPEPPYPRSWGRYEIRSGTYIYKTSVETVQRIGRDWIAENTEESEEGRNIIWRSKQAQLL